MSMGEDGTSCQLRSATALPTAPAVVRERAGGETMQAIVLEKFGGLDSLVYTDIPKPLPKDGEVVIEVRGFGHQPRRTAYAPRGMGRSRRSQRHRMRRDRRLLSGRRVPGRRQGGRAHGWPRPNYQRQLRRIHPSARGERRPHRVRTALVAVGRAAGNLRDRVDMPVPQPQTVHGTNRRNPRRDFVVRPGRGQDGGRGRCDA